MAAPVAIGLTIASAAITAYGQYSAGQAAAAQYQYQAGVARTLAKVANTNADWDIAAGEVKAQQAGMRGRATAGRAMVTAGAGNIDVNKGSPRQIQTSIDEITAQNEGIVRADAAHAAYAERVRGAAETASAGLDVFSAGTSAEAGDIAAIGSIVGGAASVAGKWIQAGQTGMFGTPVDQGGAGINPDSPAGRVAYGSSIYGD